MSKDGRRVALVSGGSRGIGAAIVRRLAADGWDVGFCYHDDGSSAREVEKAASELGVWVTGTDVDVTDAAEVTSWFRLSEEELGPVRAMVSCAGITRERPLAQLDEADWRMVIDTSLDGVFHLCRAAVFAMMERQSGRIVTVSSVCGEYDHGPRSDGMMGRPGIAGFVRALANQTSRFGITVNAVTPGSGARDVAGLLPERPRADLVETIALRRFGNAASVADLVACLLFADAPGVTGRVLEVPSAPAFLTRSGPPATAPSQPARLSRRIVRDKRKGLMPNDLGIAPLIRFTLARAHKMYALCRDSNSSARLRLSRSGGDLIYRTDEGLCLPATGSDLR